METFHQDLNYLFKKIGFINTKNVIENKSRENNENKGIFLKYFNNVSTEILIKVYNSIKIDLFLFDYKMPDFLYDKIKYQI